MNRVVAAVAVIVVIAAAVFGYLTQKRLANTPSVVTETATKTERPDFELPDTSGTPRRLSEWDGKTIVVNFWATWCPPCRKEIPVLIKAQSDYGGQGLQVIGIAVDEMDAVKAYAQDTNFNYPLLVGEQEALDAAEAFDIEFTALPFTIIIRPDRQVDTVHLGELDREELLSLVMPHLK